jgi:thioredoxin 2
MAANVTTITCPNCSTRNRVRPIARGVPRCSACHRNLPWIVAPDADGFDEEVAASVPVLADLWAPWCSPCRIVSPIVDSMAHEYAGRLKVVKVEIDRAYAVAERFGVESIPLLLVLRDGREVDRITGAVPAATLRAVLERHVAAEAGGAAA